MLLVHMELCHSAGFSIVWQNTKKADYPKAPTQEIDRPGKGILDAYLLQFKGTQLKKCTWDNGILTLKGLDGLDEANQIDGDLSDPAVAERYKNLEEKRGYTYEQTLAQQWNVVPGRCVGKIVALSDTEVIQDAGRGRHVFWDRRKLQGSSLDVGKKVTIHENGKVVYLQTGNAQER